ncbi:uridine cytidine kinase I, putative [Entamoeba invadens IP1]|uniref:Uridine cytidine kinase I, putative n=1 Tax=Entamoeba invadens IP1 TaxID=370355 RepID=A0A0A1U4E3_ENTIV|nr:uridine cytidine kinase I, putative [Entamoeba invadens IP1]ELP87731.1 uridine cytidine kinase I, putative [Entamoeba invadens IP1]|eukprot:XP_004254502.1 uridine cytidine kinase I, putative [Entamoeba invadens IP1]
MSTFTTPLLRPTTPLCNPDVPELNIDKVAVTFMDGSKVNYDRPLKLRELVSHKTLDRKDLAGIMVNGKVHSVVDSIDVGVANIAPVILDSLEGSSLYRRTLVMVFATAAYQTFGTKFGVQIDHHVNNGYVAKKFDGKKFTDDECMAIKMRMQELINKNIEIKEVNLSNAEAVNYFEQTNRPYTLSLLQTTNKEVVKCSYCDGFLALFIRPLMWSTGKMTEFDLKVSSNKDGLLLLFPLIGKPIPTTLDKIETKMISQCYDKSKKVGRATGIECIGDLNKKILSGEREMILMMENRQDMEIAKIADNVVEHIKKGVKLISIAGPSASGKTTFSKKLGVQLKLRGIIPVVLSVDDYYKHRVDSPKDQFGNYDFECLEALRLDDLNDTLKKLFAGEEAHPSVFDFVSGRYSILEDKIIKLPPNGVVIMEGLHGIDEGLTPAIPRSQKYYIFIAPLTQINIDEYNFIGNQVLRFYRRIIRDFLTRNYSASHTLKSWYVVAKGEEKYIFPYVDNADTIWDSSMDYEPSALYTYMNPLLRTIPVNDPNYNMASNLLETLEMYIPIDDHYIGSTSLIREFIGGSVFE